MKTVQDISSLHTSFILPYALINGVKLVTDEKIPVTLRFPARLLNGYQGSYTISIGEGATGCLSIDDSGSRKPGPVAVIGIAAVADGLAGSEEHNYTDLTIRPDKNWLEPGQQFASYRIGLGGYAPVNETENHFPPYTTADVLIGIQRPG